MLASITPLGQRGTRSGWRLTAGSFLIAAALSGAALGALLGLVGAVVSDRARLPLLAGAALLALALDLSARTPGPRRQVDERWRYRYRGWVFGAGYGAQLGVGVATVVASAATYLALVGAFLSGAPAGGALIFGIYGVARGIQPFATRGVSSPAQLAALHRRLARWQAPGRRAVRASLVAIAALALTGALL